MIAVERRDDVGPVRQGRIGRLGGRPDALRQGRCCVDNHGGLAPHVRLVIRRSVMLYSGAGRVIHLDQSLPIHIEIRIHRADERGTRAGEILLVQESAEIVRLGLNRERLAGWEWMADGGGCRERWSIHLSEGSEGLAARCVAGRRSVHPLTVATVTSQVRRGVRGRGEALARRTVEQERIPLLGRLRT